MPWWGDRQAAPHLRWPGTTIDFQAVWAPLTDVKVTRERTEDGPVTVYRTKRGEEIPAWWGQDGGRWESPDGQFYFDREAADRACDFFPTCLRHHIGEFAGRPFDLLDYQRCLLIRPLFGWKRAHSSVNNLGDVRRFRTVFAFLPKGSGKSPLGAGIGVYLTACDDEPAAEVYACANDKNQARVVFDNAKVMVEEMPEGLTELFEVTRDTIAHLGSRSSYKVLSSDATTKHGFRPHGVIFDEFHGQPNRNLYETLKKSMPKRRQPVMLLITHAGHDDEGICYEEYEYAKGVLSGSHLDDTFLPVIFEAKAEDDWTDIEVLRRVHPGLGITVQESALLAEIQAAKNDPRKKNDVLMYFFNRWVTSAVAWLNLDDWDAPAAQLALPSDEELRDCQVTLGIDMSQKYDLTAAVLVFKLPLPEEVDPLTIDMVQEQVELTPDGQVADRKFVPAKHSLNFRIAVLPAFWLPEDTLLERVREDRLPYDVWREQGLLRQTPGGVIDEDALVNYIQQAPTARHAPAPGAVDLVTRFPRLKEGRIGYDPAFATSVALALQARNLPVVEVPQNYTHLSEACQVFEALVKAGRVIHGGHRLLRQHAENVLVKRDDAGRIKPVKPKKRSKRIDGVAATLMGLSQMLRLPPPKPKREPKSLVSMWTPEQGFAPIGGASAD